MLNNTMAARIKEVQQECSTCDGKGRVKESDSDIWTKKCEDCNGTGYITVLE